VEPQELKRLLNATYASATFTDAEMMIPQRCCF
jgi:hypothetical protein